MVNVSRIAAIAAIVVIAAVAAACGATDTMSTTDVATAPGTTMAGDTSNAATGPSTVTVDLSKTNEFSMTPSVISVPAGKVTFKVNNDGTMVHEMAIVKTDKTPQQLTKPDGTADESTIVDEADDIPAGASKSLTLDMIPGKYILLCNLPGHYAGGMYAEFTVT